MGAFPNPFAGNVSRKMSNAELMQALRFDISGELEAIFLYDAHYHRRSRRKGNSGRHP